MKNYRKGTKMSDQEEKIQKLQMLEQNLQQIIMQKQQFQAQLAEVDSALTELSATDSAYRIIGNIMVAADKHVLTNSLKEKKEMAEIRVKSVEKQERKLKEEAQSLREDVMKHMKENE